MSNAIEAENLTKYYGDLLAVEHVNFEVKEGEIFGLLGPNGAGKTTTIRMLTCLTKSTEGDALVAGHDVLREPRSVKEQIGLVPESSNLYDELT